MGIQDIFPAPGSHKRRKRVGRGTGSGHGKTSGRGHKGQKARGSTGGARGFEGGQMPLIRRLPKRGFTSPFREPFAVVNVRTLAELEGVAEVTVELLRERGLIRKSATRVKILGEGELPKAMSVKVHAVSNSARAKIEGAGGTVQLV